MVNQVKSNIARYIDKQNNQSIVKIEEKYSDQGVLEAVMANFIGTGSSSGQESSIMYDFKNKVRIGKVTEHFDSEETLKEKLLDFFNKNPNLKLCCTKKDCVDPDCQPKFKVGNKMFGNKNAKAPYFTSTCNATEYYESEAHLRAKINIYHSLKKYSEKSKYIQNVMIEKVFSNGSGQERRADVYYEKVINGKVIPVAVEVQRSNVSYDELKERTQWYKDNGIAPFWVIIDDMFSANEEVVSMLSKKNFKVPLLSLVSYSMEIYGNRFFVYDNEKDKVMALTIYQDNLLDFNGMPKEAQSLIKSKFSTDNLYIIGNGKETTGKYELLPYKKHRLDFAKNIYSDIAAFGIFEDDMKMKNVAWNNELKYFEFKKIASIGEMAIKTLQSHQKNNAHQLKR